MKCVGNGILGIGIWEMCGYCKVLGSRALVGRNFHAVIAVVAVFILIGGALGRHLEAAALAELGAVVLVEVADLRALQPRAPARLEPALTEGAADALRIRMRAIARNSRRTNSEIERSLAIRILVLEDAHQ